MQSCGTEPCGTWHSLQVGRVCSVCCSKLFWLFLAVFISKVQLVSQRIPWWGKEPTQAVSQCALKSRSGGGVGGLYLSTRGSSCSVYLLFLYSLQFSTLFTSQYPMTSIPCYSLKFFILNIFFQFTVWVFSLDWIQTDKDLQPFVHVVHAGVMFPLSTWK